MKTIGLIGGASFASTLTYYKYINERCYELYGNFKTPKQIYVNLNFQEIVDAIVQDDWVAILDMLVQSLNDLHYADVIIICSNTLHKVMHEFLAVLDKPFINIMDPLGKKIENKKVLLLATNYTVHSPFYAEYLKLHYNVECTFLPDDKQNELNNIIFNELCHNYISKKSEHFFRELVSNFNFSTDGIVLGCTELSMPFLNIITDVPIYESVKLHAHAALEFSVS